MNFDHKAEAQAERMGRKTARVTVSAFVVKRPAPTKSSSGDVSRAFTAIPGNPASVRCQIVKFRGSKEQIKGDVNQNVTWVSIAAPARVDGVFVDVKAKDVLDMEARGLEPARTYQVSSVNRSSGVMLDILASYQN